MALDGIFLHAIKNEIEPVIVDSRIEKIHQPTREEIVISFRGRNGASKLLLSAKADCPRVHLTEFAPDNPSKPPMLCMLLRKRLMGARLLSIKQDGLERILTFVFEATNELGDRVVYNLVIEIMARHSNIILVDEMGTIVDSVKRIDFTKSSFREILPNIKYCLPPQQDKLNILTDDINIINERINSIDKRKSKAMQDVLQGVSPIICREIENGVSVETVKEYAANPKPYVIIEDEPKEFCFMPIFQYGDLVTLKEYNSFSELLDYYYYQRERESRVKQRSADLYKQLNVFLERSIRKTVSREKELEDCKDKERLRLYGDLINANLYRLEKGSLFYDLEDYNNNNEVIRVSVNPTLTPSQNAQKYYKEYRKKQIAESKLTGFIKVAREETHYLESVIDELLRADNEKELAEIKAELFEGGYIKKKNKNEKKFNSKPLEFVSSKGFNIYVGKNNIQNDKLTLKTAKGNDIWLHVKDFAGSHVIIETNNQTVDETTIKEAAILAAFNSKCSASSNVEVDYTPAKNVKKPHGAMPGKVIYDVYNTIYVTPTLETVERLKKN